MRRIDLKNVQAARPSTIRDINRQIVLNYVREREPISRAEIAREAALNRSTVSLIIDELKADDLVEEVGAGESRGGRPPTLLRLRTDGAIAVGIDIGVAKTTIAISDLAGRVIRREDFATHERAEQTIKRAVVCVRRLIQADGRPLEGVGVSVPGVVDPATGCVSYIPYFGWRDLDIAGEISAALDVPATIDNDANAAALAELWFGRPEVSGVRDFVAVLVNTGIGTGIVLDGQIYRGRRGAAGEFGHMVVGQQAPVVCSCGNRDCWEAFSCERAALARYAESRIRIDSAEIDFDRLTTLALAGDRAAQAALRETAHYLGIGITNLVFGLTPEAVIVGGAIVRAWSVIGETLRAATRKSINREFAPVPIIASTLGEQPTLMGALSLVLAGRYASVPAG